MILTGTKILESVEHGHIDIDPFEPSHVNPASVDLRLGSQGAVYKRWAFIGSEGALPEPTFGALIDAKNPAHFDVKKFEFDDETGILLRPGVLYLLHTLERVHTKNFVPVLDGKSSIGRLGVVIHLTAGYGDPGFNGQYTLEVTVMHSVKVYAGMRFCQMRFHRMDGPVTNYQRVGHYIGEAAQGPVASKVHTQFKK